MTKIPSIVSLLFLAVMVCAGDIPTSIDTFTPRGEVVEFVQTHDPGYIVLRLTDGSIIDTTYDGVEHKILWQWEEEGEGGGKPRKLRLCYTNRKGVHVRDPETGVEFFLTGTVSPHPIDRAELAARGKYDTTADLVKLKQLALAAWDTELDRAYGRLGGDGEPTLKKAKEAWETYRKAQAEYLRQKYSQDGGTIGGLIYMDRLITLARNQAQLWQAVLGW